ncbi:SDR family NAD(P)-dependent oxidoreductase [Oscillatoria amoena NRMC-F 0135]|nr:SDR family NAD(P)-dependent oxidoreductase [Oscillatoria laete-virens]MDL5047523.1 SDR family NAD(P)-dependent oxidoreductase [Oscillatoria amoena NRMC-F 0135]MDL5054653.1 SDR family NAD(P)-dependent oxidoreductase [Oscillatoria laete-virens NRMC-F 0139]
MTKFSEKYGPWALVTGASSGIGHEFAVQLARAGLHVAVHGRDLEKLDALSGKLRAEYSVQTRIVLADFDIADSWRRVIEETRDLDVRLLVNNAGYIVAGGILNHTVEEEIGLLNTNCLTPLALAHHYAAQFARAGRGGIIFTSSIASHLASPFWTQYAATKSYELLLAESLWAELRPHGVDVLALCPGPTDTLIFRRSGSRARPKLFRMPPEPVVSAALRGLGRKPVVTPGLRNQFLALMAQSLPRRWRTVIQYHLMKNMIKH